MPLIPSQQILLDAMAAVDDAKLKEQLEAEGVIVMTVDPASGGDSMATAVMRQMPRGEMVIMDIETSERRFAPIELPAMVDMKKPIVGHNLPAAKGNRAQRRRAEHNARKHK